MDTIEIRSASVTDHDAVRSLLERSGLPTEDIREHLPHFSLLLHDGRLLGVVGLEVHGDLGLLRSLAIDDEWRGRRLGIALVGEATRQARALGLKELYLLTTTAEGFFSRLGFLPVSRDAVPVPIRETREFGSLCPSAAICMVRQVQPPEA